MAFFNKININDLTDVDRAIFNYVNDNIDKIPYMRVREIASESHTSPSSVMRFIHKNGYESFSEFKNFMKLKSKGLDSTTGVDDGVSLLARDKFPREINYKIQQVAELVMNSENIVFFGMGASGSICEYAARRMAIIGCNASSMTDPTFPLYQKLRNTSDNMLIVLSVTGTTAEVIETVSGLKNIEDFTIVAITSDETSTLAGIADITLSYQTTVRHLYHYNDMTSQIPTIFLVETLVDEIIRLQEAL